MFTFSIMYSGIRSYSSKDWSVWFAGRTCQLKLCLPMAQGYGVLLLVIVIEHTVVFYSCLGEIYVLVFLY